MVSSRRALALALLLAGTTSAALAEPTNGAPGQKTTGQPAAQTVQETDQLQFQPVVVHVARADVVKWTNTGSIAHNVTFDGDPAISSGTMQGGDSYEIRFTAAGTYQYRCTFHPGMNGTVGVSR